METLRNIASVCTVILVIVAVAGAVAAAQQYVFAQERKFEREVDHLDNRYGQLEQRLGGLEQRLGGLEQRLGGLEQRLGGLEISVNKNQDGINHISVTLDALLALIAEREAGIAPLQPERANE